MKNIPTHIAIIMDGNGRWAQKRGLPKVMGHRQGAKTVREITTACSEIGVKYLTLYAFSTENWKRPKHEVSALMKLLGIYLKEELKTLMKNEIRLNAIGDIDGLPGPVSGKVKEVMDITKNNKRMTMSLALNYGGRAEILNAVKSVAQEFKKGECSLSDIDDKYFQKHLYTKDMPDPDLLIRTSGEMRISNFLLWQLSYAELYVTKKLWPDFTQKDLVQAIEEFNKRERRFGG